MDSHDPPRRRWPRSQRFSLSEKGVAVAEAYMSMIVASRATQGRPSFDAARAAWAQSFSVLPDDGLYLSELTKGPVSLEQLLAVLDTCGQTRKDALAALGRLFDAALLSAESQP